MTGEEMERAIESVVKQQAQFATDLGHVESTLETVVERYFSNGRGGNQ